MEWVDRSDLIDEINNVKKVGYIYKFYGENDTLIYIGKSVDIHTRMIGHRSEGRVWPLVARIEIAEVNLIDMKRIEGELIHKFHPIMNRQCIADCYRVRKEQM